MSDDLLTRPATELAGLVRSGEVTARELTEAALRRIDERDPQVGAFMWVDEDGALAAADAIQPGDERPLAGVPIAIKDIGAPLAGAPYTMGSGLLDGFIAPFDGAAVTGFKNAGCVIVGKTKSPEFGILPVTEPRHYGPARNPWDLDRTPGGSSGGSAAAVAAGIVPLAHANDGGGSIRIPAACCGLVGLKPSRGRVSMAPAIGDSFLVCEGAVTRTVRDTAVVLDALSGYVAGDATWAPPPAEPFTTSVDREPGRLRIGLTTRPPIDAELDPVCEQAARDAADRLSALGHDVIEVDPPWMAGKELFSLFTVLWAGGIGSAVAIAGQLAGREVTPDAVEPLSWVLYEQGRDTSALDYLAALGQLQIFARGFIAWMSETADVLLTPGLAQRPVPVGTINGVSDDPWEDFARSGQFTPFTAPINLSGQPAISVPLFQGEDGLPTSVQLVGPPAGEALLLSLAAQLEQAHPWAQRLSPLAGG